MRSLLMGRGSTDARQVLSEALENELTDRQRQMVMMYYFECMPMKEIAERLRLNPSTVSRTLATARMKLKKCLRYGSRRFLSDDL